jgi:hypothetical protein
MKKVTSKYRGNDSERVFPIVKYEILKHQKIEGKIIFYKKTS